MRPRQGLVARNQAPAEQVGDEEAGHNQDHQREDGAQPGNPKAEQRLGPIGWGNQNQEPVHQIQEQREDQDRCPYGEPDQQAGHDIAPNADYHLLLPGCSGNRGTRAVGSAFS